MKQLNTTVLILAAFLAASSIAYGGDGLKFKATLSGAQEVSEVDTPATGMVKAKFDKGLTQVNVDLNVKNTVGTVTRAHFHCAGPGENGPIVFGLFDPGPLPVGEKSKGTLTNDDFTGLDCVPNIGRPVNNIAALAFAMRDGLVYVNVHTSFVGSGEIRGKLLED